MLISFYKYMVNNFCPTLVESDKWGDVSALLILQLDQARGCALDLLKNIFCVFQLKYFGLGVNKKGQ